MILSQHLFSTVTRFALLKSLSLFYGLSAPTLLFSHPPEPPDPPDPPDRQAFCSSFAFEDAFSLWIQESIWSPVLSPTVVVGSVLSRELPSRLSSSITCPSLSYVSTFESSSGLKFTLLHVVLKGIVCKHAYFSFELVFVGWKLHLIRSLLPRSKGGKSCLNWVWIPHITRFQVFFGEDINDMISLRWNLSSIKFHLPLCEAIRPFVSLLLPLYEDVTRIILLSSIRPLGSYVSLHVEQGLNLKKLGIVFSKFNLGFFAQDMLYWQWLRMLYCISPMLWFPSQLLRSSRRCVFTLVLVTVTPTIVLTLVVATALGKRSSCVFYGSQAFIGFLGTIEMFMCSYVYHFVNLGYVLCLPIVLGTLTILVLVLNNYSRE